TWPPSASTRPAIIQEGGLPAARRPEEREELAGRGVERDFVDRDHRTERLAEPADAERRRGAAHRGRRARRHPGINARSRAPSAPTTPGTSSPPGRCRERTCAARA